MARPDPCPPWWDEHESDEERDARFAPLNDEAWGAGNWVRCATCPTDARGRQVYHHRNAHGRVDE